ncbi:MAG: hypothetical protein IPL46_18585 [Saprospiraceae bacterium]|nr:hypothetical protein [Saprospiraceae bacterium]
MKKIVFLISALLLSITYSFTQGCVAVRNISGFSQYLQSENGFTSSNWILNVNNRYFKSFRDFRGSEDLKTPSENESINRSYNLDLSTTHLLRNGWSISLAVPIVANSREASMEHGGPNTRRYTTHSFGLGDIRLIAGKWLLKPNENLKGNVQIGLGLKFATGDYKYQDYFHRTDSTTILAPVNPGIQLGDGGLGLISEINAYYRLNKTFSIYTDLYYLSSPREQNGVPVLGGRTPTDIQVKAGINETSVTDVYSLRAGVYLDLMDRLTISGGIRYEGVPVNDIIGGSGGTRRPGYNFSIEPGLIYRFNKISLYTYIPFIVSRSIDQSVPDQIVSELTNQYTVSPGGSGNYQLFIGVLLKL